MKWFGGRADPGASRDPELPLSVAQAQLLRRLVRDAWARLGREVVVHSDHVVDADGGVFGLWNLAVLVGDEPRRRWPRLVGEHVRRLAAPTPSVDELSEAQLRDQVVLRVVDGTSLPDASWFPSAPTLAGDLRQVLVVDLPDSVMTPPESYLAARGELDELRAAGRANLWYMMRSEPRALETVGADDGQFHVLLGDSVYTASMAVFLPELVSMVGQADLGRGILVALPHRHQVAFRVVDGPGAVVAIQNLCWFAMAGYNQGAGAVSPHVFWVKDGHWEQLTAFDEDQPQAVHVVVGPELATALGLPEV